MEMVLPRAKMLMTQNTAISSVVDTRTRAQTYDGHLFAFGAGIFVVTETLCHNFIICETSPEEHTHLAILSKHSRGYQIAVSGRW